MAYCYAERRPRCLDSNHSAATRSLPEPQLSVQALFTRLAIEPDLPRIAEFKEKILAVIETRLD